MARFTLPRAIALAVGAFLAAGHASAGENVQLKPGTTGRINATTMTLGGTGSAAQAAAADDTELAWWCRGCCGYRCGFYRGFYGGLGYAGFYPYYSYVYPSPYYYGVGYYPPVIGYGQFGGVPVGVGINGTRGDAPAMALNLANIAPATQPVQPQKGLPYRYDGGPAAPVPQPKPDLNAPNGQSVPTVPANTGLPVSLPKNPTQTAKPYTYKAYGEK